MKDAIGLAPQQVLNPVGHQLRQHSITQGHGYHNGHGRGYDQSYAQQLDHSGYLGSRNIGASYEPRPNRRPSGAGGVLDMGRGMGPGQGSFHKSHIIGAEYEPHNVDSTSNGNINYQQHVRKHQQDLHVQGILREEYRTRGRQIDRRHSAPQVSQLYVDQNQVPRLQEMRNNQQIPIMGYPRSHESQSQGPNLSMSYAQQQQQQQQRLRVLSLDAQDYPVHCAARYSHTLENGSGTGSVSGITSIVSSPNDSRRSHSSMHTPQMYDMGEFDQSMRSLPLHKNEMHYQNFNFNPNQGSPNQNQHQIHNGTSGRGIGYHPRERDSRQNQLDMQRHRSSRDSSPSMRSTDYYRSLESSTHGLMSPDSNVYGLKSLESSTHGLRSMESSTHGIRGLESFVPGPRSLESSSHGLRSMESSTHGIRGLESFVQGPRSLESSTHGISGLEMFVHGIRSLESSTHGPRSLESSTHGIRSLESSTDGARMNDFTYRDDTGSVDEFNRSCVSSLDGFSMLSNNYNKNNNNNNNKYGDINNNSNNINNGNMNDIGNGSNNLVSNLPSEVCGSFFPTGILDPESHSSISNNNSHSLACISGHSQHGSLISSSPVQSYQSTTVSSRSSSIGNEEDAYIQDSSYTIAASLALNEYSDAFEINELEEKKVTLYAKLFPLIEAFKPFLAKSITDYLVKNVDCTELSQLVDTPDLLLPHYIAVALSMMTVNSSSSSVSTVVTSVPVSTTSQKTEHPYFSNQDETM